MEAKSFARKLFAPDDALDSEDDSDSEVEFLEVRPYKKFKPTPPKIRSSPPSKRVKPTPPEILPPPKRVKPTPPEILPPPKRVKPTPPEILPPPKRVKPMKPTVQPKEDNLTRLVAEQQEMIRLLQEQLQKCELIA